MPFASSALRFFRGLAKNNNREWFEAHRAEYEGEVREPMRALILDVNQQQQGRQPRIIADSVAWRVASRGTVA